METRETLIRQPGSLKGLTLLKTMLLVAFLGLLATGAASLWLKHAETASPPGSVSEPSETAPSNPSD